MAEDWLERARQRREADKAKTTNQTSSQGSRVVNNGNTNTTSSEMDWLERARQRRYEDDVRKVDDSYISNFLNEANNFYSSSKSAYDSIGWSNASAVASSRRKAQEDLDHRHKVIGTWLENNRSNLTEDSYRSMYDLLDSYSRDSKAILNSFDEAAKYYSQWETEEDYNDYLAYQKDYDEKSKYDLEAGQNEIKSLEAQLSDLKLDKAMSSPQMVSQNTHFGFRYEPKTADPAERDKKIKELENLLSEKKRYLDEAKYIQGLATWNSVTDKTDFDQKNKYVSNVEYAKFGKPYFTDDTYAYVNNPTVADKRPLGGGDVNARSLIDREDAIYKSDTPGRNRDSSYARDALEQMTEDEIAIYNYYYATEGKEKAREYLDFLVDTFQARKDVKTVESAAKFADEHPFISSAMSVGTSLGSGFEYVGDVLEYAGDKVWGKDAKLDRNENALVTNAVRGAVAEKVDWEIGNWDAFDFVYNTTMSGIDSAASLGFGGMAAPVLGLSAAAQATNDAMNRGMSDGQAFWNGIFAGTFECLFESVSIGQFKNLQEIAPNSVKDILKNLGKSMLVNASEETLTEIANIGYDTLVNGEFANYTLEELENGAWKEALAQVIEAGASGMLMGLGMGGAGNAMGYYNGAKALYGDSTQELIQEGLESDPNSRSYKLAQKYQKKTAGENGKELSGVQIRKLVNANEAQFKVEDYNEALPKAKERLAELGETENVDKIAELAAKRATGQKLTRAEKSTLARSQFGAQVAKEMTEPAKQTESGANGYKSMTDRVGEEGRYGVSESGQTTIRNENEAIAIAEVTKIEDGQMTVKLEDGREVYAGDIDFANDSESFLYSAVADMENITPAAATALVKNFAVNSEQTTQEYVNGVDEAYTYGFHGYSVQDLKAGNFVSNLSNEQMMSAYKLGQSARAISNETHDAPLVQMRTAKQAAVSKKQATQQMKAQFASEDVEVYFEDGSNVVKFDEHSHQYDDKRMAGVNAAKFLSKMGIGGKYFFYESYENADGVRVYKDSNGNEVKAPNGIFKASDGSIHIDINAGNNGEGTTLFTMGHELTHFVKANSKTQFQGLAELVKEAYDKTNMTMHERVVAKQNMLSEIRGEHVTYDEAFEEVVADAMSTMLTDGNLYEKLAQLKTQDKGLFNTIKRFFDKLISKFKKIYASLNPDQKDAQDIRELKDMFDRIQDAFAKALVEASDNFQASETVLAQAGISVDANTDAGSIYSVRDVLNETDRNKVAKALAERFGVTVEEAKEWLKAETSLASLILNPKYSMYLDYEGDPNEVAIKQNSDYPQGTVDFSNICKKRREFTQVMNRILRNFPNHVFAATDLAKIRTIMGEEGMTLPCGICYVEDRRQLDTIVAQDFINGLKLYREGSKTRPDGKPFNANQLKGLQLTDGDTYVPTIYELVSLEGRNSLKAKNPNMEAAWVRYNNARGMQAVRLLTNEAEYKRQILKYSKKTVQSKNDHGGLRIYSFSDAEMFHLIDIIQVITDSATVGLSLQGYTKVNEYAKAVKDTGEKLNRSLIPKGDLGYHMENGKVVLDYDTVEGIDIHHKDFFDNKDNPNVGNITIGINDVQIRAAMLSDFVDQIIPFHTGQSEEVLGEKGIAAWDNYKDSQTEKDLATGRTSSHQVNIYTEVFQAAEAEGKPIQNKRQFVEKFLQVCKENGLQPRFAQFLNTDANGDYIYTEGYHKFLVDFKTFAQTEVGEYLPQMPVKPIFDDAYITGLLEAYVKEQQAKDAEVAEQMPKVIERITNEIVKPEKDGYMHSDRKTFKNGQNANGVFVANALIDLAELNGKWWTGTYDYVTLSMSKSDDTEFRQFHQEIEKRTKDMEEYGEQEQIVYDSFTVTDHNGNEFIYRVKLDGYLHGVVLEKIDKAKYAAALKRATKGGQNGKSAANIKGRTRNARSGMGRNSAGSGRPRTSNGNSGHGGLGSGSPHFDSAGNDSRGESADRKVSSVTDSKHDFLADGKLKGNYTVSEISEMFDAWNSDAELTALSKKVFAKLQEIQSEKKNLRWATPYEIKFVTNARYEQIGYGWATPNGLFTDDTHSRLYGISYNLDYFRKASDQDKAKVLLHEAIHACTVGAIRTAERRLPKYADPMEFTPDDSWSDAQKAGLELIQVFSQVRVANERNEYGQKDVYEMVAEMANPEFRSMLKKQRLWDRIVGAIKRIFGVEKRTAYDAVSDALEKILELDVSKADAGVRYSDRDYVAYDRTAILKESKVDEYLHDYAAKSSPKYAQAYIAYMRPRTFLKMTTDDVFERYHIADQAGELDEERLSNSRPGIYLRIDHETGEVTGHEGRHRMSAMDSAGINLVPVLLLDTSNKMTKTDIAEITLHGQFDETAMGIVKDLIPLNYENRDRVIKNFATQSSTQRIGERYGLNKTLRFSERTEDSVSNRSLLANAFEGIVQNSVEYKMLQDYRGHIKELNELESKLSDLNREIRKIRFGTEGARDAEKLKGLEDEAKKVAKEINRYDKRLLNMEASEPLRKVIDQERKKEAQKTKDHVKEIQQNKKVRAEQTALRHKIRKTVRDLDKILNRGNKKLNVKEDMQAVVSKALKAADILFTDNYGNYDMLRNGIGADLSDAEEELVNTCTRMLKDIDKMPSDGYDSWQARQEAEKRLSIKMSKLKEVFARERKRLNNTTVSSILGELADAYASLEKSEQSYVQSAYTEAVHNFLKNLQSEVGGAIVKDMTKDQLESVYAAYKMVLTAVRTANKMFNEELKQSREQLGNAVIQEVMSAGGTHGLWTKGEIARNQASWNNMKPVWVANRIGSDTFGKLMNGLFKGQYNFAVDVDEAKQFKLSMDAKYHPRNWDAKKLYSFESSTGRKFELNLQQIMSLYAFSKREQAYSHLLNGGFVFEANSTVLVDKKGIKRTYLHDGATSYKLNEVTLNEIISSLTAEQKAYVDEMQKYLSEVMGAKGNEVSMKLYGIQMFKEKFYFPLRSSGAYMEKAKEAEMKKQQGQINLVNSGFTHAVKPEAKNPIILAEFMDVWAEHCNEMSMYHSMVLPMEDFRKVYNYSTVHDEKMDSASVYQTIQDAYGKAATGYIDQLYRELNAGATVDPRETAFKSRISKFKKAAVMLSASVVVQQFSSIGRSYAVIDPKYFIGAKVKSDTKLSVADEMKKYAPVAIIKEMGGFDTGTKGSAKNFIMAEQYRKGERIKGLMKDEQYRGDIMSYFPAKADEITWCSIWEAVKRETKAKHQGMDVKSEEFLKLAGERFSEVIEKTQVYDSVLARSANMRSKGGLMSMATAFMAEPTTTINLLEDALRGRSVKNIARAFGAVATSIVLNNALASIVYAMRDDDDDETFIEKYFQSFASGMVDDINPMTYYPFLKDVYSLFQGYDVERADMSVIADLRDALKKAMSVIGKDTSEMEEDELADHYKQVNGVLMSLLDAGCSALGVPLKNVRRDANGIINAYNTIQKDLTERDTTWISFWDNVGSAVKDTIPIYAWTKDRTKQDKLYEAIIGGDTQYVTRLKSGYKTDESYHNALRKALRENDPRVHDAAVAWNANDLDDYMRIAKEIIGEKHFVQDDVVMAIRSEANALAPDDGEASTSKAKGLFTAEKFAEAIAQGDQATARAIKTDIIQTAQKNGKTADEAEKSFESSAKGDLKEMFLAGSLTETKAINALTAYCGETQDDAEKRVGEWAFEGEYGFTYSDRGDAYKSGAISAQELQDILVNVGGKTEEDAMWQVKVYDWQKEGFDIDSNQKSVVEDYETFCEPAGIDKNTYFDAYLFYTDSGEEGVKNSKVHECMPYISRLPLTSYQKTALALCWWAESTVRRYKTW